MVTIKLGQDKIIDRFAARFLITPGKHCTKTKTIWLNTNHSKDGLPMKFEDHLIVFYPF